jgi:hypothetical protein
MDKQKVQRNEMAEIKINLKLKLASLWAGFMFLYIYVDYFHLFMPGVLEDMLTGKVFIFEISPVFLLAALTMVTIPALMIFLSIALSATINRYTNIIVAIIYIPFSLFNLTGKVWAHMVFGAAVEIVMLCLIIRYAWKWPNDLESNRTDDQG